MQHRTEHPTPGPRIDPDHHLWRNGRLWWIAFTVHRPDWTKQRLRFSLGTRDVLEARRRRDAVLRYFERRPDTALSLRYARLTEARASG